MIEALSILFGGLGRLGQHWLDLKDKDKERDHEHRMTVLQMELADKRFDHDAELRRMDASAAEAAGDTQALIEAIQAQTHDAQAAGGRVAALSAAIRPLLTLWHCVLLYTAYKVALFVLAYGHGISWESAVIQIYGDFDRALVGSIMGFWFADRALRRWHRG